MLANITCSCQEGTEANAGTLVFKLHHVYAAGRNRLEQLLTELNQKKKPPKKGTQNE